MQRSLVVAGTTLLAIALSAAPGQAQGSSVYTQSACASGRANTAAANPCADGSAILYNPAALALQPGTIGLGVTGIWSTHTFEYDLTGQTVERDPRTVPVPQGYLTARLGERVGLGIGVFAPYGGRIDWPLDFEGRFVTYDQTLRAIYIQPTASFAIVPGALSVGGGIDFVRGSIDLNQRADLSEVGLPGTNLTFGNLGIPRGTDFADVNLAGSGGGTGWHIGVLMQPVDWIGVGMRYMHRVTTELEGDATFQQLETGLRVTPGSPFAGPPINAPVGAPVDAIVAPAFQGPLANQGVRATVTWPEQAVIGLMVQPLDRLQLLVDYHWFGWSSFGSIPVEFEGAGRDTEFVLNYNNAEAWRFGAEYGAADALRVRAGYVYNTAASPASGVSPFLPEAERNYYTVGLGYRFPMGLQLDAFYQLVDQDARRGRTRSPQPGQDPLDLNIGVYTLDAHVFGAMFSYQPGFLNR